MLPPLPLEATPPPPPPPRERAVTTPRSGVRVNRHGSISIGGDGGGLSQEPAHPQPNAAPRPAQRLVQAGTPSAYQLLERLEQRLEQRTRNGTPPHMMIAGFDVHPVLASHAQQDDAGHESNDSISHSIHGAPPVAHDHAHSARADGGAATPSVRISRHGSISIGSGPQSTPHSQHRASAALAGAAQRPLYGISAATKDALAAIDSGYDVLFTVTF